MSIYNRTIARRRPIWKIAIQGVSLLSLPFLASALDKNFMELISEGHLRPILLPPVIIIYILIISQVMVRTEQKTYIGFRELLNINDEEFKHFIKNASSLNPIGEFISLGLGIIFGLGIATLWDINGPWLRFYVITSLGLMYGLLTWTIFCLIAGTKLIASLHKLPIEIDLFNIKPFEPIGRYSLIIALVYILGVIIGMVFGVDRSNVAAWQTWLFFIPITSVGIILFFLSMRHTHRLLSSEKKRLLLQVQEKIIAMNRMIKAQLSTGDSINELSSEYLALVAFENRLRSTSTWPYNTSMLRTLFVSILLPLIVRGLSALLFGQ